MPRDLFKPKGKVNSARPEAGGAILRTLPVFGVVKDNIDPIRSGRLRVYISDLGGRDPNDSNSWVTVNYMTPFYGKTTGFNSTTGFGTYLQSPAAYGMWYSPPDIDSVVICVFINGDPDYGYWIGCVPEPEALYTVPAMGSAETVVVNANEAQSYGGATKLPVANINSNNDKIDESPTFWNQPKPVHSYLAGILNQQGLIRDTIRGAIGTSAQRETPSRVGYGVSTPGRPIYEGGFTDETIAEAANKSDQQTNLKIISRRAGHSFVMDDGDLIGRDQMIRLRSSLGHQILLSDDGQTIHIIHANGQSWVELGKEGTIDMYATNSVNVRTQGDLNLHADNNINMHAKKDFNIYGENINVNSDMKTNVRVGSNYSTFVKGVTTMKTTGAMSFQSSGEAGFASAGFTYINGKKINLNTGECSTIPQEVQPIALVAHTDTLYDSVKGWAAAPGYLLSITTRAPAHAPWANANQGIDVKINNDADSNFPANPAPALTESNNNTTTPSAPVNPSVASTVPPSTAISQTLDKNTTAAMVAQTATIAQTIPAVAAAIKNGAGVVEQTANGLTQRVVAIGAMAQTPQQLEAAGVLKAGSASLVNNLVQAGKTVEQALTNNLFAGKQGAESLTNYLNNPTAQVATQVTNFQQAQTQLTQAGLITGKESAGQLAGIVTSGATAGIANTVTAVKTAAGALGSSITGPISSLGGTANNLLGSAQNLISSGNFAGNLASTVTGGLSSIAASLNGLAQSIGAGAGALLNSAKGIAASAFTAIKKTFPNLKAGEPQNLKKIYEESVAKAQNAGSEISAGGVTNAFNTAASLLPGTVSSGLGALPGAQKAVATVVNNAKAAINSVPGTAGIGTAIDQLSSSIITGTPPGSAATTLINQLKQAGTSLQSIASTGLPAGAAAQLNSAISSLSSGGSIPIKLPTVALNTVDRSTLTSQTKAVFGSTKIPVPNFSGNPATTGETPSTTLVDKIAERKAKIEEFDAEFSIILGESKRTRVEFDTAFNRWEVRKATFPAGDPAIEEARAAAFELYEKLQSLQRKGQIILADKVAYIEANA